MSMLLATMNDHHLVCVVLCTYSGESSDLVGSSGREVTGENWKEDIYIIFIL